MNDIEFELFKQYKDKLIPDEQLYKLLHNEDYQEKEKLYRMRLIEEYRLKV